MQVILSYKYLISAGVGRTGTLISLVNLMIILTTYKSYIGNDNSSKKYK